MAGEMAVRDYLVATDFEIEVFRIPIHYELGRLHEAAGRPAEARAHYEAYLSCWGEADVAIANAEDARERVGRLGGL